MIRDTEEVDLVALYERGAALRERIRIIQILEFGMATDRMTAAVGLAFRTPAPAMLAIELMQLTVTDAEMLRRRVEQGDQKLKVVVA